MKMCVVFVKEVRGGRKIKESRTECEEQNRKLKSVLIVLSCFRKTYITGTQFLLSDPMTMMMIVPTDYVF